MADPFRMDGKTALITGAGRGIGKAIAKAFAGQGAELLLTSRNEEKLRLTAQELTAEGAKCRYFPADLSCMEDRLLCKQRRLYRLFLSYTNRR